MPAKCNPADWPIVATLSRTELAIAHRSSNLKQASGHSAIV